MHSLNSAPSQKPDAGSSQVRIRGDILEISVSVREATHGISAWLRTNIGAADMRRQEIIARVEDNVPILARDWHDVPMRRCDASHFTVSLPLTEVGRFEAKTYVRTQDGAMHWAPGENTIIKVEPEATAAANTTYCAFTRLFGEDTHSHELPPSTETLIANLDAAEYTVIPRSGTFRDLIGELDHIVGRMGFRIVQLLPIFPTPTTYARMGRFGSPFASLDFTDVDPALAEFDRETTPLDQFRELCDAVHCRHARLFLDVPVNHTGWSSWLQMHHPEWFVRNADGTFQSPGAWGVTWEDLARLDYQHRGLWRYIANVFLFWCRQGVDGFRCDAGYMIPAPVWEYIVAIVRREYPSTLFLLEGLGGKTSVVNNLLRDANLDWAYSELFQTYTRREIEPYLAQCSSLASTHGLLVHFAETHDNDRLAAQGQTHAVMRTALCALCSDSGGFGITCGVEWFAEKKIDVHNATPLNWKNEPDMVAQIVRLTAILESHPAFHAGAAQRFVNSGEGDVLALRRDAGDEDSAVLVLINLSTDTHQDVQWFVPDFSVSGAPVVDLLTGLEVTLQQDGDRIHLNLEPGAALCLCRHAQRCPALDEANDRSSAEPARLHHQHARATALTIVSHFAESLDTGALDPDEAASRLLEDPEQFCTHAAGRTAPVVTHWQWPHDTRRDVPWPQQHVLLVSSSHAFRVALSQGTRTIAYELSLVLHDGTHAAVILPFAACEHGATCQLGITVYADDAHHHDQGIIVPLSDAAQATVRTTVDADAIRADHLHALCTNGRGAMVHARAAWSDLRTQYDALLAANLNDSHPVDRQVLLTRCRVWLVQRDYSQEIDLDSLQSFSVLNGRSLRWQFHVPCGMGRAVGLEIDLCMQHGCNATALTFRRLDGSADSESLDAAAPVTLIVRPDLEDRNFHSKTKAYKGPERGWPQAITETDSGFRFAPGADHALMLTCDAGRFTREPEWHYMVSHPTDAERGLEGSTDLFSPGFFSFELHGGEAAILTATATQGTEAATAMPEAPRLAIRPGAITLADAAREAMHAFVAARGSGSTVIAGYPWFLDWGRDTLICLRGMIAADMLEVSLEILTQFARFESRGTLPNMIHGDDDANRDTSDAPLWFIVACADLRDAEGSLAFLAGDCGDRTLRDVVLSIGRGYRDGTPNGIGMDPASGLIFSPSHYTWMDTNHPAGTPREGYPIEIQALWYAALKFFAEIDREGGWAQLAEHVGRSIQELYTRDPDIGLSDCLHATAGQAATEALADDALRPNQLLAITLGAVRDHTTRLRVLRACQDLLIPGAIRSLADRPVRHEQPVWRGKALLNDPRRPYWGHYEGDEDTRRKPAYHNGTAWTWPFPSYPEALLLTHGDSVRAEAHALLAGCAGLMNTGCLGHLPEILDGDTPHRQRGCGAQAWGVTELYRVLRLITGGS